MQKHDVSIGSLTNELEEIRHRSLNDGKYSASVSAVMGKAKIHGLDVQKVSVTVKKEYSAEERVALLQEILARTLPKPQPVTIDNETV